MSSIPNSCFILVIGGGPAGAYAATCLANEGHPVVVLEAEKFPRYHIGESMLPSMRHFLRYIDLEDQFEAHGFTPKVGSSFKFNPRKREGYSDFVAENPNNYSWNVVRSEADELILNKAKEAGASVFDGVKVSKVSFEDRDGTSVPVSATWRSSIGETGTISFQWLIDASGRNGVLSKALGTRKINQSLRNVASWGYWTGAERYQHPDARVGPPLFQALLDESGWAWFLPLHNGTASIGVVMDEEIMKSKKAVMVGDKSSQALYMQELSTHAPMIWKLLSDAKLVPYSAGPIVRSASDYSYASTSYSGPNYRIIGDAGAFIDPFFSSGVHLALSSALSASATICAAIRGDCSPDEASKWHDARVGTSYTRFLIVVLSAYRQIRAQKLPVLSDIDEDNFDRAFENFRVVIQGDADVPEQMTEDELLRTIDFCTQAFEPASLEDIRHGDQAPDGVDHSTEDAEAKLRTSEAVVVARGAMGLEDIFHIGKFVSDKVNGRSIRLQRGDLTLI